MTENRCVVLLRMRISLIFYFYIMLIINITNISVIFIEKRSIYEVENIEMEKIS